MAGGSMQSICNRTSLRTSLTCPLHVCKSQHYMHFLATQPLGSCNDYSPNILKLMFWPQHATSMVQDLGQEDVILVVVFSSFWYINLELYSRFVIFPRGLPSTPKLEHPVSCVWAACAFYLVFQHPILPSPRFSRKHNYDIYSVRKLKAPNNPMLRRDVGFCYAEKSCHSIPYIISSHRPHMLFYRASSA